MKGSVAVRRASPPHLGNIGAHHHHHHHHFPPMAVDSLHHHHANNHNSHQHMARIKAGVARTTSSSSAASSSSVLSSSSAQDRLHTASSTAASSAGSERLTPRRFLEKYSLPRVVRVLSEPCSRQPLSGPLAQPLLLYRHYTSCKVLARSLRRDKHAATETGPPLVIPDSYQGKSGAAAAARQKQKREKFSGDMNFWKIDSPRAILLTRWERRDKVSRVFPGPSLLPRRVSTQRMTRRPRCSPDAQVAHPRCRPPRPGPHTQMR
ncbi:hypothetical protein ONE63_008340 [Megalurothrips usitatus]|uniref:Uncharacterized protein n=1 Tax=Megalurothrips usitatus TaxID=439358 RepID=A0AAV7XKU3_9NEOP|nr:hypothetical protein ONE63_008340 [Megalurothrips usitatus]